MFWKTIQVQQSQIYPSIALKEITTKHNQIHHYAVGEVMLLKNERMDAVIGGEGNGGVIYQKSLWKRFNSWNWTVFINICKTWPNCKSIIEYIS